MPQMLSGPGIGLGLPQNLYPSALLNAPVDFSTNQFTVAPGQAVPLPAGDWYVHLGLYLVLQHLDPVSGRWVMAPGSAWTRGLVHTTSDGFGVRVANLTGCIVGAVVTAYGTGYVQASTAIAVTGSTAAFAPVVGGQLAASVQVTAPSTTLAGAGYGVAPILYIPAPPPAASNANGVGGVQASGYVTISGGTVSGVTLTNPGAGYPSAPTAVVLPNPTDPNISSGITAATIGLSVTGSGSITAALLTNSGAPLTDGSLASVTLTVSGAGSSATIAPLVMQTIKTASVTGGGTGALGAGVLTTYGGGASAGTITNSPEFLGLAFLPRPAQGSFASVSGTALGTIVDGGLFLSAPTGFAAAVYAGTAATIALVMGSRPDIVTLQPAP